MSLSKIVLPSLVITCSLLATLAGPAMAGNIKAGEEKSAVCQGCHGPDGNSIGPDFPHLAGQLSSYLTKQIDNFQKGVRTNETMNAMVAGLNKDDIADIVAYFSSKKIKPVDGKVNENVIETGKKIFRGGNSISGVPACSSCHGPNGAGNGPAQFPLLAGQRVEYVTKTLNDFKAGRRSNDPNEIMRTIAGKMTENEIKSVAAYITYIPIDRKL
jgi:cytochrome c553